MSTPNKSLPGRQDATQTVPAGGGGSLGSNTTTASLATSGDARSLRFARQKMARKLLPKERVAKCHWTKISMFVEGWKSIERGGKAHFRGVMTCGSVWKCPVCASKITERRKVDLENAIAAARVMGLHPFMVTLTLQHGRDDLLSDLLADLIKSIQKLRGRKFWTRFKNHYGIVGSVTALEVTYGLSNGWHPHKHIMFFTRRELQQSDYDEMKKDIANEYKKILAEHGRDISLIHGVDVRGGDDRIADYIAKYGRQPKGNSWTLAAEMTKANQKNTLRADEHYTPFQLLDFSATDDHAGRLFQAYALTMKYKKLLSWSRGLRKFLGMKKEQDDLEIAQLNEDRKSLPFTLFDWLAWRHGRELPHEVLQAIEQLGFASFREWAAAKGIHIEPDELSAADIVAKRESIGKAITK